MEKRFRISLLLLMLLPMLLTGSVIAEDTGITLKQAVQVAWTINSQSTGTTPGEGTNIVDVAQANTVALNVAEVVIDLDFARIKYQYLAEQQKNLKLEAEKADIDFKMGKIDAKVRDGLKQKVIQNDFDLNFYKMQIDNGEKGFQRLTGTPISANFNYQDSYLIADAGKLSLPPSATQDKDLKALEKQLNDVITAFSNLGALVTAYIDAGEKLTETENDFKTGKVANNELEAAEVDKERARIEALEGKAQYSKLLYEMDCNLQGHISRDVKKLSDPIFQ